MFSKLKAKVQKKFKEDSNDEHLILCESLIQLQNIDMSATFCHCGYLTSGRFDPTIAYDHERTVNECEQQEDNETYLLQ